jgi:uncharacterized membrane protein (UPF0127 family)
MSRREAPPQSRAVSVRPCLTIESMKRLITILGLVALISGCGGGSAPDDSPPQLPATQMQIGARQFTLEKAITFSQQEMGLMRRDGMPQDHGMIFIFDHSQPQHFWNKNVRFPLDLLFLDHDARIVSIQNMQPYDESGTKEVDAQWVIELNAGVPAAIGVKVGDMLTLPADAKSP